MALKFQQRLDFKGYTFLRHPANFHHALSIMKTVILRNKINNKTRDFQVNINIYVTFNDPKDTGSRGNVKNSGLNKTLNIVLLV